MFYTNTYATSSNQTMSTHHEHNTECEKLCAAVIGLHCSENKAFYKRAKERQPDLTAEIFFSAVVRTFINQITSLNDGQFAILVGAVPSMENLNDGDLVSLQTALLKNKRNKHDAYLTLATLAYWISQGNVFAFWTSTPVSMPIWTPSPVSPYGKDTRLSRSCLPQLERVLRQSLSDVNNTETPEHQLGRFVLSGILQAGIHNHVTLRFLLSKLKAPLNVCDAWVWIDFVIKTKHPLSTELRRWYPDPLTELLFYRLNKTTREYAAVLAKKNHCSQKVFQHICHFVSSYDSAALKEISSLSTLFAHVNLCRGFDSSPLLAAYQARQVKTHSLRASVWLRVQGVTFADQEITQDSDLNQEEPAAEQSVTQSPSLPGWLDAFRQDVLNPDDNPANCIRACRHYLNRIESNQTLRYLIPAWVVFLLSKRKSIKANNLKVSTIKGYLSSVATRLIAAVGDVSLDTLSHDQLEEIYWEVIDDADSESLRQKISKGLKEFHDFLVASSLREALADQSVFHLGRANKPVDANLITFDEYQQCLAAIEIDRDINQGGQDVIDMARMLIILGFKCGLRRSEALKLRLCDYHPGMRALLFIRPWRGRQLKTKSSTRNLPLYALLDPDEKECFYSWYQKRLNEIQPDTPKDAMLFFGTANNQLVMGEERIFSHLLRLIRSVTQDTSLRFHHLRHAFATWTLLRLYLSDEKRIPVWFPQQPITQAVLERSAEFRHYLYGHQQHTRKHLYAVSSLLGHAGPAMSLEHYIHCIDLLSTLKRDQLASASQLIKLSPVATGKLYEHKAQSSLARLLMLVRAHCESKGLIISHHEQQQDHNASETRSSLGLTKPTSLTYYEKMKRCYAFLDVATKQNGVEMADLILRFGYSEEEAQVILNKAHHLVSLKTPHGNPRFKIQTEPEGQQKLVPSWRLGSDDEKSLIRLCEGISRIEESQRQLIDDVCADYLTRVRSNRTGVIFSQKEIQAAQNYVDFFLKLNVYPQEILIQPYRGCEDVVKPQWVTVFNELGVNLSEHSIAPDNAKSQSNCNSVRIKIIGRRTEKGASSLDERAEIQSMRVFMYMLNFM